MIYVKVRGNHLLREDAAKGLKPLEAAANRAGYAIIINSAKRDSTKQASLFAKYVKAVAAWVRAGRIPTSKPKPVAAPGTSEHELGIALDLDTQSQEDFAIWLAQNCAAYGWYLTALGERWHIAYYPLGPPVKLLDRHHSNVKMILG